MGKGDKKGQALSSAKAAELLAKRGGQSSGGFGGFSGAAPAAPGGFAFGAKYIGQVASVLPAAAAAAGQGGAGTEAAKAAIIPADLDGELSQQLQKLSKRDATTKLKALQALKQLVREKDAADVQQSVPSWAYLYSRLVMDNSRTVRAEASHVMGAIAAQLGRSLAPFLKSVLPCWWLAQYDAYADAAAAARSGLAAAFPAAKQRSVVLFCRAEVLQLLSDNLSSTPQTLGDAKKEAPEDLQERHERVLAATCAGMGALLDLLGPQQPTTTGGSSSVAAGDAAQAAEAAGNGSTRGSPEGAGGDEAAVSAVLAGVGGMLCQQAFLKGVLQSKAAPVRRAGLSLVAPVARKWPALLQDHLAQAAPAVLGALSEKDPDNHPAMWDAILSFGRAYPAAWPHANLSKAFLPRLWALLRHACFGSAAGSFPAVLPLVTLLPPDALTPAFFTSLLTSTWKGLEAAPDSAGKQAAAASFKECMLYALLKSEQLVQASRSGSSGAGLSPEAQRYCMEILEAVLSQTVLPAASSATVDAATAALAADVLVSTAGALAGAVSAAAPAPRLQQLLKLAGSYLSFAVQQSLEQAEGGADLEKLKQEIGGKAAVGFERVGAVVAALADAAAGQQALMGEQLGLPLISVLLPEVRAGSGPPAAASLLAALLKRFPQHAALPVTPDAGAASLPAGPGVAGGAAALPHEVAEATGPAGSGEGAAGAPMEGGAGQQLGGEMAALRLQQSATYTIESMLRRCVSQGESSDESVLAASCDLLLSCLPQVANPGRKFGECLLQLLVPQSGSGTDAAPQVAAALMLVKHLLSGEHPGLTAAGCSCPELDRAGRTLTAAITVWQSQQPQQARGSSPAAALAAAAFPAQLAELLTLLLVGDGRHPLLSLAAQADVLEELLSVVDAAAPAEALSGAEAELLEEELGAAAAGAAEAAGAMGGSDPALLAVLWVVRGSVAALSPGPHTAARAAAAAAAAAPQGSSSSVARSPQGLLDLQLWLLAAVFRLLTQHVAGAAAAEHAVSDDESSSVSSSEDEEQEQQHSEVARLAREIWGHSQQIYTLVESATAAQRAAMVSALQGAIMHGITHTAVTSDAGPAAAAAAAQLAALVPLALDGCCGNDTSARQAFLQPLLQREAAEGSSEAGRYSFAHAAFIVSLGQTVGFEQLLSSGDAAAAATSQPAAVAVGALTALVGRSAAGEPASGGAALGQPLQQHLVYEAAAGRAALLAACLEAALTGATLQEDTPAPGGSSSAAAAADAGASSLAVLASLLQTALLPAAGQEAQSAAAAFFSTHLASSAAAARPSAVPPLQVLQAVLPIVAPRFRSSQELLQQSGLPELSVRLCQAVSIGTQGAGASTQAQLLTAIESAFPVPAVPPIPGGSDSSGSTASHPIAAPAVAKSAAAATSAPATSFSKGDLVWYQDRDGSWLAVKVVTVDVAHHPPTYGIEMESGGFRETEGHRLQPRQPGSSPPPTTASSAASDSPAPAPVATSPAPARAAAAAAASRAAPAFVAPLSTEAERAALLLAVDGCLSAAPASPAEPPAAGSEGSAGGKQGSTQPAMPAGHAELALRGLAYCWQQLGRVQWGRLLAALQAGLHSCCSQVESLASEFAEAITAGAAAVAGMDVGGAKGAVQFWRRLQQKGVVGRLQKARETVSQLEASLQASLAAAQLQLLPALRAWLRTYALAAALSPRAVSLPTSEWHQAEAAACADGLQLFVSLGSIVSLASEAVGGRGCSLALGGWLASGPGGQLGGEPEGASWQELLSQQVLSTLRQADAAFLEPALVRANGLEEPTGSDAVGALLAFALAPSAAAPRCLRSAAYQALLLHPALLGALAAAEGVAEEDLEHSEVDAGDSVAMLEQVLVRPELAAAVSSPIHPALLPAWALLAAHVLALPPDSHGRRLLVQTLKEAHEVVPGVLNALVPLLPLDGSGTSGSGGSGRGGGARAVQAAPSAAAGHQASPAAATPAAAFLAIGLPASSAAEQAQQAQQQQQQALAVQLYSSLLQALPASARLWFSDLRDRGTAAAVERYTSSAVSAGLLAAEFTAVANTAAQFGKFDKFSARANPTSREVIAVIEVEDGHMLELLVKLPSSMPLRAPELECRKRVGVSEGRLRKWLLSISAFLRTQNGSVAEAISLWKRNVDKEFEGQEECLICYSILQPTSGQLPRLACRTCRKKFHAGCLYKWFKSSGKSTCPHCTALW